MSIPVEVTFVDVITNASSSTHEMTSSARASGDAQNSAHADGERRIVSGKLTNLIEVLYNLNPNSMVFSSWRCTTTVLEISRPTWSWSNRSLHLTWGTSSRCTAINAATATSSARCVHMHDDVTRSRVFKCVYELLQVHGRRGLVPSSFVEEVAVLKPKSKSRKVCSTFQLN